MQPMTKKKHTTTSKRSPARSPSLSPPLESRRRVGGQSPERLHGNAPPTPPRSPPLHPPPRSIHADSLRRGGDHSGSGNCNGHVL
uniref:B2 n=1 Tax=Human betaherpesvirus 6 TaxID=10368 RepID=A0A5P9S9U2_9BETA|nr:B2 [Human betaherpesvirus 6]QFV65323.1 B2 [Human betaherpesvirus 6]QFV80663.1 B2 [Human betaherpesvirus 6]QFV80677.1 B2 [Human betaherpesvirus 6]QFV94338.1 B2 [Human betaherpesvirus 6]